LRSVAFAKQPKLKPAQEAHLVELWRAGKHTSAELAELFSVARSTVYRAVQSAGEPKKTVRHNRNLRVALRLSFHLGTGSPICRRPAGVTS
jgi:DNA invertase Pin-like site-specific DNA recombinase